MAIPVLNAGYFGQAAAARRAAVENEKDREAQRKAQLRQFGMDLGTQLLTRTPFDIASAVDTSKRTGLATDETRLLEAEHNVLRDENGNVIRGVMPQDRLESRSEFEPAPQEAQAPSAFERIARSRMAPSPRPARGIDEPSDRRPMELRGQDELGGEERPTVLDRRPTEWRRAPTAPRPPDEEGPTAMGRAVDVLERKRPFAAGPAEEPAPAQAVAVGERTRTVQPGAAADMPPGYDLGGYEGVARRAMLDQWSTTDLKRAQAEQLRGTEDERVTLAKIDLLKKKADAAASAGRSEEALALLRQAQALEATVRAEGLAKKRGLGLGVTQDKPSLDAPFRFSVGAAPVSAGGGGGQLQVPGDTEVTVPLYTRGNGGVYTLSPRAARVPVAAMLKPDFDPRTVGLKGDALAEFGRRAAALRAQLRKGAGDPGEFASWVRSTSMGEHPGMTTDLKDIGDVRPSRVVKAEADDAGRRQSADEAKADAEAADRVKQQVAALQQKQDSLAGLTDDEKSTLADLTKVLTDAGIPLPSASRYPQGSRSKLEEKLAGLEDQLRRLRVPGLGDMQAERDRYKANVNRLNAEIQDVKARLGAR